MITAAQVQAEEQLTMFTKKTCNCRKWNTCLICRNAERRRAFLAGDVPVYRRIAAIGD
jgi:hypothetical protein